MKRVDFELFDSVVFEKSHGLGMFDSGAFYFELMHTKYLLHNLAVSYKNPDSLPQMCC